MHLLVQANETAHIRSTAHSSCYNKCSYHMRGQRQDRVRIAPNINLVIPTVHDTASNSAVPGIERVSILQDSHVYLFAHLG